MDYPLNNQPATDRYDRMQYKYCGKSGLQLPLISLGLWHNFGSVDNFSVATDMIKYAFDHGITHFDLANNYGPVPGSAETNFGRILKENFQGYRDEMIISSKAGHDMWAGPYGGNSSRKNLMASIDQSLRRTGLEYFDIFYSHRYDGVTPVEETIQTLIDIVKQGKALYIGISKYPPLQARIAYEMMAKAGVPCLISQYRYSMFDRAVEAESLPLAAEYGSGFIAFSPLAQGLLTDKYLNGIPEGSRAARPSTFLQRSQVTPEKVEAARQLNEIARHRGQTLAEMALAWVLRDERMTSVIVGASSVNQLADNLQALNQLEFTAEELNNFIAKKTKSYSKLRGTGQAFIDAQNKYGANALLLLGLAANESAWGTSQIAQQKNNLFGINAIDSSPGASANSFETVEGCINDFAKYYISRGYSDPEDWRYFGGYLGNKGSGANVKYASDPFWGEKAGQNAYIADYWASGKGIASLKDYNYYQLGIYTGASSVTNKDNEKLYDVGGLYTERVEKIGATTILTSKEKINNNGNCLLYTSPSPRDRG